MNRNIEQVIEELRLKCDSDYIHHFQIQIYQYGIVIKPTSLPRISKYLYNEKRARLMLINASRIQFNKIELSYVFSLENISKNFIIVLKTWLPEKTTSIQSITPIIPSANFFEREISEMIGIKFIDHPTPYRLILPYEWPETS